MKEILQAKKELVKKHKTGGFILYIPDKIKSIIGDKPYSIDKVGMSNSQVLYFDDMVLKIENQSEESDNEHRMMAWLDGKLPVPKVLCF